MSERGWKVSIVGHGLVDPRTLAPHPRNPKVHPREQDEVVAASLRELGWVKSLTINRVTGHVLDGHERLALALAQGVAAVPVEYVEVAAAEEGKALLVLDQSAALALPHMGRWAALRGAVQTEESALLEMWTQFARQQGVEAWPAREDVPAREAAPQGMARCPHCGQRWNGAEEHTL